MGKGRNSGSSDDDDIPMTKAAKVKATMQSYLIPASTAFTALSAVSVYFFIIQRLWFTPLYWFLIAFPVLILSLATLTLAFFKSKQHKLKKLYSSERIRAAQAAIRHAKDKTIDQITKEQGELTNKEANFSSIFFISSVYLVGFITMNLLIFSKYSIILYTKN